MFAYCVCVLRVLLVAALGGDKKTDPVIAEFHRVLKVGGTFALVSGRKGLEASLSKFQGKAPYSWAVETSTFTSTDDGMGYYLYICSK